MNNFTIKKLKYAFTEYGISNIKQATKDFNYFLDKDLTIPLVLADGTHNVKHWRKKSNISNDVINSVFGKSESIEHYNEKIRLSLLRSFEIELSNGNIIVHKPAYSKTEHRLETNQIVDIAFFDQDNNLSFCVEVFHTNKKTYKDIQKFNKVNTIVYEYNIDTKQIYPISAGLSNEKDLQRIRSGNIHIQRLNQRIQVLQRRIDLLKKGNERVYKTIKAKKKHWADYYKEEFEITGYHDELRERIAELKGEPKQKPENKSLEVPPFKEYVKVFEAMDLLGIKTNNVKKVNNQGCLFN